MLEFRGIRKRQPIDLAISVALRELAVGGCADSIGCIGVSVGGGAGPKDWDGFGGGVLAEPIHQAAWTVPFSFALERFNLDRLDVGSQRGRKRIILRLRTALGIAKLYVDLALDLQRLGLDIGSKLDGSDPLHRALWVSNRSPGKATSSCSMWGGLTL